MEKYFFIFLITIAILGCSLEERPSQSALNNTLPNGGTAIEYSSDKSFTNIDKVTANLSADQAEIFNRSLGWYGTESNFDLARLNGKTARQVVEIVNCLKKVEKQKQQLACFK